MNHTYQTTNQTNTTQTTKTTTSTWVSPLTQSLCSYNWDNTNSGVLILTFQPISKNSYSTNFLHFIHHQFVHFIDPEKPVRGLMNNFVHFIHPYMNSLPEIHFFRSSYQRCPVKKWVLRNFAKFTGKHICQRLWFSCEFSEISKNTFFIEHLRTTSSDFWNKKRLQKQLLY